jgi:uncharacterized membrane-anchored protein
VKLGWRLAVVVVLQTAALVYMIGARQWTLATGTPVVLETEPIDPRSLFSGDYVRLNYRISRLDVAELAGERNFRNHEIVYVTLRPGTPFWRAVSVCHDYPVVPAGDVAIRGQVTGVSRGSWNPETRKWEESDSQVLAVHYGIETYFVPEGEGRELERPKGDTKVTVRVAVDRDGKAAIQAVLVNGVARYEERVF